MKKAFSPACTCAIAPEFQRSTQLKTPSEMMSALSIMVSERTSSEQDTTPAEGRTYTPSIHCRRKVTRSQWFGNSSVPKDSYHLPFFWKEIYESVVSGIN